MAALVHLIQTTWRGLEGGCHRVAGSHLSGGGLGSVTDCQGHWDVLVVAVVEVAVALLLTAFEYWLWEVEVDAQLHLVGTVVVRAGQEASLEVVQGHVAEIYLLAQEQVLTAGAGYPAPAYVAPQGGAGEEGAP